MKCAFCQKKADTRVDIGGHPVPVCAKHYGSTPKLVYPTPEEQKVTDNAIESMIDIEEHAGREPVLD
jgi:hypothetical protein